jgi:hypothetical protein
MLAGVVAWRLFGSTYHADIETICDAETRSGFALPHEWPELTAWVRAHLATPEGNQFYSSLGDVRVEDRARRLSDEAVASRVASCPMVGSYDKLAADAEYRRDLQRVCSRGTLPDLADLDDSARLEAIAQFIDANAKSSRTRDLAERLREAGNPVDRARILRQAAHATDVFTCDVASTLELGP